MDRGKQSSKLPSSNTEKKNNKGQACTVDSGKADNGVNWKSVLEKRGKMYEIQRLKNKIIALQNELYSVTGAANNEEAMYGDMKKSWGLKMAAISRAREDNERYRSELRNTMQILENRMCVLRKDKEETEEKSDDMKKMLMNLENDISSKVEELDRLKSDVSSKQAALDVLKAEGQKAEEDYEDRMKKFEEEREDIRKAELDSFQKSKEMYRKEMDDLEEKARVLTGERDALRSVVEGYVERVKLLEEKEQLLTFEFHHFANADIFNPNLGLV